MSFLKTKKGKILLIILVIILLGLVSFTIYISDYYHADATALAALNSTNTYSVENTDNSITFTPTGNKSATGIIYYPGGKVQPEAYSVVASKLAMNGYTTIIVKMPFNLAFFGADSADEVTKNHPEISSWVIAGHSLGGVFASEYAVKHPDKIKGIVYLAAYPSTNASNATFKAVSIRGSLDNLTKTEDISKNLNKFPANTTFITIEGGNHYNNGNYGVQTGDNNSTITREEQQQQTVNAILQFIKNL